MDEKSTENKTQEQAAAQEHKTVPANSTSESGSIDSFSSNLIMENQKKMVLQIEQLEKRLSEAKRNEEKTLNLLREKEALEKARVQGELVNRALGEYPVIGNAKDVAVSLIKSKLSFDDNQQPLWEGKQVDDTGLKTGLETFFKENSFLLDKSVKTQTPVQSAVKQQPGTANTSYDMKTIEGMQAFLQAKMNRGKK